MSRMLSGQSETERGPEQELEALDDAILFEAMPRIASTGQLQLWEALGLEVGRRTSGRYSTCQCLHGI
jgi:hypothetical protein